MLYIKQELFLKLLEKKKRNEGEMNFLKNNVFQFRNKTTPLSPNLP